jgi:hypothetical protein
MACTDYASIFHDINIEFCFLQILTGHQDNAEFALAMCRTEPYVLSGGDCLYILKVISTISMKCRNYCSNLSLFISTA